MIPLFLPLALLQGQSGFALHDGDRVLFYGDSITDNQFYPQYVENYVVSRFPGMKITFMNYGWSGDKVSGGGGGDIEKRLSRDVFPYHPTVVTIMLGMNDGLYRAWDENTFKTFSTGYEHILDALRTHGAPRVTLIKPSPYDDVTLAPSVNGGGYNSVLQRFGDYLAGIVPKYGASVVDFNAPMVDLLTKSRELDAENARKLIPDRVHPTSAAHIVMGNALLKGWNAPSLVSATQIDAAAGTSRADNAAVRDLKTANDRATWREMENALPVYFDKGSPLVALVLKSTSVFDDVNQEPLKVSHLSPGTYRLSIDDQEVGQFTNDQLDAGINLADLSTPMVKQAALVALWTARRQFLRQTTWRNILVGTDGLGLTQRDQALRALDKLEADLVDHQRQAAKPTWHTFSVERVADKGKRRTSGGKGSG